MQKVLSNVTGIIASIPVSVGQTVAVDDDLVVIESMKMEIPQAAERAGVVQEILVQPGTAVQEGDTLMVIA